MKRLLLLGLIIVMMSNVANAMERDSYEFRFDGTECVLSKEVLLLATVGAGGLLFSAYEGSVIGALCFMTMLAAAALRFERQKNYLS